MHSCIGSQLLNLIIKPCSSPSPSTMRIIQNIYIVQMCPEGVRGPRLRNKSAKNVWGRRPHTVFSILLCTLGPQTPSRHNICSNLIFAFLDFTWGWTTSRKYTGTGTPRPAEIVGLSRFGKGRAGREVPVPVCFRSLKATVPPPVPTAPPRGHPSCQTSHNLHQTEGTRSRPQATLGGSLESGGRKKTK